MRAFALSALPLLLGLVAGAAPPEELKDPLVEEDVAIQEKLAETLKAIPDAPTAKAALPVLAVLDQRERKLLSTLAIIGPRPPQVEEALQKKYGPRREAARAAVVAETKRLLSIPETRAVLAGAPVGFFPELIEEQTRTARLRLRVLVTAVAAYRVKTGTVPPLLDDLTRPLPGETAALLEPALIVDPWGRPFRYDPKGPKNEGKQPDIWCVTPEFNVTRVLGNWPAPK